MADYDVLLDELVQHNHVIGEVTDATTVLDTHYLKLDQSTSQTISGGQPIFDTLTASQLVATDASKKLQTLTVATYPSLTELTYVKGVTSAIQTQLNAKLDSATAATTYLKLDASNDPVTGDLQINSNVGIGIAPSATAKLYVNRDSTENTGSIYSVLVRNTVAHTANSNGIYYGLSFGVRDTAGNAYNITGSLRGVEGTAYKYGNSVLTAVTAFEGQTGIIQANSTGSITTARGLRLTALNLSSSGATIGSNIGVDIANDVAGTSTLYTGIQIGDATTSTATNKYGINVGKISGGTNNYGIFSGSRIVAKGNSTTLATTFTGAGLNDMSQTGVYGGSSTTNLLYTIVIDGTGTPDTFKWKAGNMDFVTGVAITGGSQALRDGVSIRFTATTGHTLNDQWTFNVISLPSFAQQATSSTTSRFIVGADGQIGVGVAPTDGTLIKCNTTNTSPYYDPAGFYYYGATFDQTANPSANTVSGWRSYGLQCNVTKIGNFTSGQVVGGRFNVAIAGGASTYMTGGGFILQQTSVNSSATTLNAGEFEIQKYTAGTSFTATTAHLMRGAYSTVAGTWAITTAHGLYLSDISIATNNYAIVTNAGNIVLNEGGDPNVTIRMESDTEVNMFSLVANADTDGALYFGGSTNGVKINKGGDLKFIGTGSGLSCGSFYMDDGSQTVTVSATDTYYEVGGGMTGGKVTNFTFQNSKELLCLVAGNYLVNWSMTVRYSGSDTNGEGAVMINSTAQTNTVGNQRLKENGIDYNLGGTGIITLAVNDVVKLAFENETATGTATITHANLALVQVGAGL